MTWLEEEQLYLHVYVFSGQWKITSTPKWEVLKDTLYRSVYDRVLNLSTHASDFSRLFVGQLVWLVEIPFAWLWLV